MTRHSDERAPWLADLLDQLTVGVERLDREGVIVFSNRAHHEMHDYERGELIGRSIFELVEGDDARDFLADYWKRLLEEQPPPEPWIGVDRCKDGSLVEVRVDWNYERDKSGALTGFVATVTDITTERRLQRERDESLRRLEESRLHLASLMESAVDFVLYRLATTPASPFAGEVVFVSPSIREIMGVVDEKDFSSWFASILPEDLDRVLEANRRSSESGDVFDQLMRIRHPRSGEIRWLRAISRPILGADGRPEFFNGLILDVTRERRAREEQQRLQSRLQQGQRLESLGTLAGGIAHDFNNLLVGILGSADLASQTLEPDSAARPHVEEIFASARRAAKLTSQLLAYSGQEPFNAELVDLNALLGEMSQIFPTVAAKKAEIDLDLAPDLPPVKADEGQLRQVIMNLVSNASDALGGEVGTIRITTRMVRSEVDGSAEAQDRDWEARAFVELGVSDSGAGIDTATLDRIYDPFFTTKELGRGLGMAAVRGIVQGHGGSIHAESTVGRGSTFTVALPAAKASREERSASGPDSSAAARIARTILVIDDEELVRTVAERMLLVDGHQVVTASDGVEGIEILRQRIDQIDTVLLDMSMPKLSGVETFHRLRALRPDLPVILTTGYSRDELGELATTDDNVAFLQKPYPTAKLREVLAALAPAAKRSRQER